MVLLSFPGSGGLFQGPKLKSLLFYFFTPALTDSSSREYEWQQISSGLSDSSKYSSWSWLCCSLDSSSNFQLLLPPFQAFGFRSKCANYNWYHRHSHVPQLFSSPARYKYLSLFSFSLIFTLWYAEMAKSSVWHFFCQHLVLRILPVSFSCTDSGLCRYHLVVWSNLRFLHRSLWIPFPIQSCLLVYSFYASLQHSLVIW